MNAIPGMFNNALPMFMSVTMPAGRLGNKRVPNIRPTRPGRGSRGGHRAVKVDAAKHFLMNRLILPIALYLAEYPKMEVIQGNRQDERLVTKAKVVLAGTLILLLAGCDSIPTNNLSNSPISIKADGQDYVTCGSYSLSEEGWGKTVYTLSFKDAFADGANVTLKGVEKLTIKELPLMVNAQMPSSLPDIKTDHPSDGGSYQEGSVYTWQDGTMAKIQNGTWVPVKKKNTICDAK
jgi:hypothetical protein